MLLGLRWGNGDKKYNSLDTQYKRQCELNSNFEQRELGVKLSLHKNDNNIITKRER